MGSDMNFIKVPNFIETYHKNWAINSHKAPTKPTLYKSEGFYHVLMIKKHDITGMKYLCKMSIEIQGKKTFKDCYSYLGSGKRWLNHLKFHGKEISTFILLVSHDINQFRMIAFNYSMMLDVVNRDDFANLTEEKGDGGLIGTGQLGKTWKIKDTTRMKKPKNRKNCDYSSISGGNNYQCKWIYHTPWGVFDNLTQARIQAKQEKENGNHAVTMDITSYCKGKYLPLHSRRVFKDWRGKHTYDLGFKLEKKDVR